MSAETSRRGPHQRDDPAQVCLHEALFELARKEGFAHEDPFEDFQLDAPEANRIRNLNGDEERRLYQALRDREEKVRRGRKSHNAWLAHRKKELMPVIGKDQFADHMLPLVTLAQHTGMRRGELFGLRCDGINFKLKQVTVRGETAKTGTTRHLPLDEDVMTH